MRKLLFSLLFLALLSPRNLWAWGADGHRAVAKIAEDRLSRKAKRQIQQLLGNTSLADVATWADDVRNTPEYKHTAPWHFVNLPLGLDFPAYSQQLKQLPEANAYKALQENLRLLGDTKQPREKRIEALKFVVHIVGDVHQPMHVSRAEDKGGNDIKLHYDGHDSNLHRVWDSELIKTQGLTYTQMATEYNHPKRKLARQWRHDSPEQWLFESYQLSQKQYAEAPADANLDQQYYTSHIGVVDQRLQQGGIRLAEVLNKTLR
jgi:hypothetical protein